MILNKLPKELQEYVKKLARDECFQYYIAHDPVLDTLFEQRKKEENTSSMSKKIDERAANLIVEHMVRHGKVKAEDFDNILKLMFPINEVTEEKNK